MARVKFKRGSDYAKADRAIFYAWEREELSTREAAMQLAESNGIYFISTQDFEETAMSLGYFRRRFDNDPAMEEFEDD